MFPIDRTLSKNKHVRFAFYHFITYSAPLSPARKLFGPLEEALLDLPEQYRIVVMLRDVEELSTSETAAALDLTEHNVKVRLHRGRAMARGWLFARVGTKAKSSFAFMGVRCDRVVHGVFARLAELSVTPPQIQ